MQTPGNDSTYCFVEEDNKILFPASGSSSNSSSDDSSDPVADSSIDANDEVEDADFDTSLLSAVSDSDSDSEDVDDINKTKQTLMITTIVFGALSAFLGSALCWSIIRNHRERRKYSRVNATDALEPAWAAHQPAFVDPYDSSVNQPMHHEKATREL